MTQSKWQNLLKTVNSLKHISSRSTSLPVRLCSRCKPITIFNRTFSSKVCRDTDRRSKLLKPLVFTIGVSVTSFSVCTIIQYERTKYQPTLSGILSNIWEQVKPVKKEVSFQKKVKIWWDSLGEGHKIAVALIGINILTFGLWQFQACRPFMFMWFTTSPSNRRASTLILSCFSHSQILHLVTNMCVLWSFSPLIQKIMGTEQFAAFYISSGCVSFLLSRCFKIATQSNVPSLGASGALLAVLAACCIKEQDARLSFLFVDYFLPDFTFSANSALFGIIAFDVCGILFRWKLFDHACHLGGTLFGSWYIMYGHKYTWDKRAPIADRWQEFREMLDDIRF